MMMPGRKYSGGEEYRYGFNGKELDKEVASTSTYDYGFRIYSPALGRFLSVDPLFQSYPWNGTYAFAEDDVIRCIDLDGGEKVIVTGLISRSSNGWISNIKSTELLEPGPLGSGTVYHITLDTRRYVGEKTIGQQFEIFAYAPAAEEGVVRKDSKWQKFWYKVLDGGAGDKGTGSGSNQKFGIIITSSKSGLGTTQTGTNNHSEFFDVINEGILSLIGGAGGGLNILQLENEAKITVSTLANSIDELNDGIATGRESFSNALDATKINTTKKVIDSKPKSVTKILKPIPGDGKTKEWLKTTSSGTPDGKPDTNMIQPTYKPKQK